jgi:CheY-like chemotaxis protein
MSEINTTKPFRILFVDNSRTIRAVMSSAFKERGYVVTTAGTGAEAIEKLKAEPFDLAIIDLYMPVMNGYEAAKVIRALPDACKDIPMFALTASQDPKDIEICKSVGMNEYLIKSDDNKTLYEAIERYRPK